MEIGKIFLVSTVEPIPELDGNVAEWRSQQIAKGLIKEGMNVIFLVSSFDHYRKLRRSAADKENYKEQFGIELVLIPSIGYRNNVSIRRVFNYWLQSIWLFFYFLIFSRSNDRLLLTIPAVEHLIARFSFRGELLIDYRDLWPHIFRLQLKGFAGVIARAYIGILEIALRKGFEDAHSVITISDEFKRKILGMAPDCEEKIIILEQYRIMPQNDTVKPAKKSIEVLRSNIVYAGKISSRVNVYEKVKELSQDKRFKGKIFVCGSGEKNEVEKLEALCAGNKRVKYLGNLEINELEVIYSQSSFGLIPYENLEDLSLALPNKFFEYLSNNLFVIHYQFRPIIKFRERYQLIVDLDLNQMSAEALIFDNIVAAQRVVRKEYNLSMEQVLCAIKQ